MPVTKAAVSVGWRDYGNNPGNTSFLVDPTLVLGGAPDTTDLETILLNLEAMSEAKICFFNITLAGVWTGGKATATNGSFQDAAVGSRLTYAPAGSCGSQERIYIPAPKIAQYSDPGKRLVNPAYGALVTLNTNLTAMLTDKAGDTGLIYQNGIRVQKALPPLVLG